MIKSQRLSSLTYLLGGLALFQIATAEESRASYDIDCKVILCLAGGFPGGCGDAYSYMIDRITSTPSKPPFGFCAMSNGEEYTNYNAPYSFIRRGPEAYHCEDGKQLFYRQDSERFGGEEAFCYTHATNTRFNRFEDDNTIYHNQSSPQRVNFQIQITLEPGTDGEFRSPTFRSNLNTGYFVEVSN